MKRLSVNFLKAQFGSKFNKKEALKQSELKLYG